MSELLLDEIISIWKKEENVNMCKTYHIQILVLEASPGILSLKK